MQPISTTPLTPPVPDTVPPAGDDASGDEKVKRLARYSSAEFTRALVDHMQEAVKVAASEAPEYRDQ